jgi:hypothetical protein
VEFEEAGKEVSAVGLYFSLLAFLEACGCELSSSDGVLEKSVERAGEIRGGKRGGKGQRKDEEGGGIKIK